MTIPTKINEFVILYHGHTDESRVKLIYRKTEKELSAEAEAFIEENWKSRLQKDSRIHNGKLIDFLGIRQEDERIEFLYSDTSFKLSCGTRHSGYSAFLNDNYHSNHVAIQAAIVTGDSKILIGSDLTYWNNLLSWKFPGGYFDLDKDLLFSDCAKREISEELGSLPITDFHISLIAKNIPKRFVTVGMTCCTKMSSNELMQVINANNPPDRYEMNQIQFIDMIPEKIQQFLDRKDLTTSPSATIFLKTIQDKG